MGLSLHTPRFPILVPMEPRHPANRVDVCVLCLMFDLPAKHKNVVRKESARCYIKNIYLFQLKSVLFDWFARLK